MSGNEEHASVRQMLATIHSDLLELRKEVHDDRVARDAACLKHTEGIEARLSSVERWRWYSSGGGAALLAIAYAWKEELKTKFGLK